MDKFDQLLKQSEQAIREVEKEAKAKKTFTPPPRSAPTSQNKGWNNPKPLKNDNFHVDLPSLDVPEFEACLDPDSKFDTSFEELDFSDVLNPPPPTKQQQIDLSGFQDALVDLQSAMPSLASEEQTWGRWKVIAEIGAKITGCLDNKNKFTSNAKMFLLNVRELKTQAEEYNVSDEALDAVDVFTRNSVSFVKTMTGRKVSDDEFLVGSQPLITSLTHALNLINGTL